VSRLSFQKKLLFSIVTTVVVLGLAELVVQGLQGTGTLDLTRQDDQVLYLDGTVFHTQGDKLVIREDLAPSMLPVELRAAKGDAWRAFVVGGSFAMGTPYAIQQGDPQHATGLGHLDGGLPSWLSLGLEHMGARVPIEVANTTVAGQNAHRTRRVAEEVVHIDPDLLIVATCNNEGELPPNIVSEELRRLGGYRLLSKLVRGEAAPEERPVVALQRADPEQTRQAFEASLQAIARAAEAQGVPVLLATLPLNLMLEGTGSHRMIGAPPPTERPECAREAQDALEKGDATGALSAAAGCENVALGTYWTGRALLAQGRTEEARRALSLAAELQPSNRCRPSFQQVIRDVAAAHEHVHLLDLEAQAVADAPLGLPGGEQFLDSCHMDWKGYLSMAERTRRRIVELGLGPSGATASPLPPAVVDAQVAPWNLQEVNPRNERPPQAAPVPAPTPL
jgi:tetratricopeptide (TPR) repeat protein